MDETPQPDDPLAHALDDIAQAAGQAFGNQLDPDVQAAYVRYNAALTDLLRETLAVGNLAVLNAVNTSLEQMTQNSRLQRGAR